MNESILQVDGIERFKMWLKLANLDENEHQVEGVKRMMHLETANNPMWGLRGGFLTDEMGLGKTIQMLALILCNFVDRTLIVLPRALIEQWEEAIIRVFGHKPLVFHGNRKNEQSIEHASIVITTYGNIALRYTKNGDEIVSSLSSYKWGRVIFDEAHHMRNSNTGAFKGAMLLKTNIKWFVTGTPIQNSKSDVYSLFRIFGINKDVYMSEDGITQISQHFRIGRTKQEVGIKLDPVVNHNIVVDWETDAELNMAADIHATLGFSQVTLSNVDALISALTQHQLPALLRMRQVCLHSRMLKNATNELINNGILKQEDVQRGIEGASKLNAVLRKIRERKDNKSNKIVFCFFRSEIDFLEENLTCMGLKVGVVDGRTSQAERDSKFSDSFDVLILQIQASCEGLNLQSYNEIYFTSPPWNPAVQDQAIARAHRIGQQKQVHVFQFCMAGFGDASISIDRYCMMIQEIKRQASTLF